MYEDPERQAEISDLTKEQSQLTDDIETLEWDWLEASEALESTH